VSVDGRSEVWVVGVDTEARCLGERRVAVL
jgi:hypothetical protein